jgi:hypothetical protein
MPDPGGGAGVPLWWPVSGSNVAATVPLPMWLADALEIRFDGSTAWFLTTLLSWRTALVLAVEGLLFAPLLIVPWLVQRHVHPAATRPGGPASDQGKMPRSR